MNAAGLNLLKLDHVRNSSLSPERQRNECGRPMWHVGLYLYVASQLAGSTIALSKYFIPIKVSHKANFGRKEYQNGIFRSLEQMRNSVVEDSKLTLWDGYAPGHPTPFYSCEQWQDEKNKCLGQFAGNMQPFDNKGHLSFLPTLENPSVGLEPSEPSLSHTLHPIIYPHQ